MVEENKGLSQSLIDSLLSGESPPAGSAENPSGAIPDSNAPEGTPVDAMPTEVSVDAFASAAPTADAMPVQDAFESTSQSAIDAMLSAVTEEAFANAAPTEAPVGPDTFVPTTPPELGPDGFVASSPPTPPPGVIPGIYTPDTLPDIPPSMPTPQAPPSMPTPQAPPSMPTPQAPPVMPTPQPVAAFQEAPAPVQNIEHLERAITESNLLLQQKSLEIQVLQEQVTALAKKFEEVETDLRGTPAYKAKNNFSCPSCETKGLIAVPVKCTQCEKTHWWGWWPEEKDDEDGD